MIFRQLFEPESFTYTSLLVCRGSGQALLVDRVIETVERDLAVQQALGPRLIVARVINRCGDCPGEETGRMRQIGGPSIEG